MISSFSKYPYYLDQELIRGFDYISPEKLEKKNKVYLEDYKFSDTQREGGIQNITVEDDDIVSSIFKYNSNKNLYGKVCALNFANFTVHGGGCLHGAIAQEECLCYESNLYFHLSSDYLRDFYLNNNSKDSINTYLYRNRAIYTDGVYFCRRNQDTEEPKGTFCDIITCAAPFYNRLKRVGVSNADNEYYMRDRIRFILDIAEEKKVDTLILGAWGCGVFGQDPVLVAKGFKEYLDSGNYNFKNVVFAIIDEKSNNYKVFKSIIG